MLDIEAAAIEITYFRKITRIKEESLYVLWIRNERKEAEKPQRRKVHWLQYEDARCF